MSNRDTLSRNKRFFKIVKIIIESHLKRKLKEEEKNILKRKKCEKRKENVVDDVKSKK